MNPSDDRSDPTDATRDLGTLDSSETLDHTPSSRGAPTTSGEEATLAFTQTQAAEGLETAEFEAPSRTAATVTAGGASGDQTEAFAPSRGGMAGELPTLPLAMGEKTLLSGGLVGGDGASAEAGRYQIVRPFARGGLGEVFIAHDSELNREVALKEIQERHSHDETSRVRFLLEAEVTGGLEHPGIVPVYGLGQYPDGRPYYAMRFIRGDSLKEAIERFYQQDAQPGRDPSAREVEFRQLLTRFIAVCDAMHYAHSRGVLHRDLKPANIMLGPYGETLVVDWGLAKALGTEEPARATGGQPISTSGSAAGTATEPGLGPLRPMSGTGSGQTIYGSTVGTPQYMSPEQAEGKLDVLAPTSDIYSLGATLFCILTGKPPFYAEKSLSGVMEKVKKGAFPHPRQVNPRVPKPLEAICLKAMAFAPSDRYQTARALAEDLEHYLADEPVSVYREPWTVRAARWAKRHRTLVSTTAALLITAVAGLSVATALIERERARTEQQRRIAVANFNLARSAVDDMLTEVGAVELVDVPQAEPVRRALLDRALNYYNLFLTQHRADPTIRRETAEAQVRVGDIHEMLGDYTRAEAAYREAIALITPLAEAPGAAPEFRRSLAAAYHGLGLLLKKSNRFHESERAFREAIRLRQGLPEDSPDRRAEKDSLFQLGAVLARQKGRGDQAAQAYRDAVESRKAIVEDARARPTDEDRRLLGRYLNNWGILLASQEPAEAEKLFRESSSIQQALIARSPGVVGYRWELARSLSNLGTVLQANRPDDALAAFREALETYRDLAGNHPDVPDYRSELAAVHDNLAVLLVQLRKNPEAQQHLREALAIYQGLTQRFPARPDYRQRLAATQAKLGLALEQAGMIDEAEDLYRRAQAGQEPLVAAHPDVPEYQNGYASMLSRQALLIAGKRRNIPAARPILEASIRHRKLALDGDRENRAYRKALYDDLRVLAALQLGVRQYEQALATLDGLPELVSDDPRELCRIGSGLSQAIGQAQADKSLEESKRAALLDRWAPRAVEVLRQAVRAGYRSATEFDHRDYNPLRDRADFRRVQEAARAGRFQT